MSGSTTSQRITLQRCGHCLRLWYTPMPACPYCASAESHEERHDGSGTIYSWTTIHRSLEDPPAPVPYTILTVELKAGARVHGRFESNAIPVAGATVVCIEAHGDKITFRPA